MEEKVGVDKIGTVDQKQALVVAKGGVEKAERIHIAFKQWLIEFITAPCLPSAHAQRSLHNCP